MEIPTRSFTVTLVRRGEQVLLGRKTKVIGIGLFNGPGGEIEEGEDPYSATVRELEEETTLRASPTDVVPVGVADCFNWKGSEPTLSRIYVSLIWHFGGEPRNSSEMVDLTWFDRHQLPLGEMLPGDRVWMPTAVIGGHFFTQVHYEPGMRELTQTPILSTCTQEEINRLWDHP
jgi:8-oxo-dGTP diphosphatase